MVVGRSVLGGQADEGVGKGEPAVGFGGQRGTEAEGAGKGEAVASEAGHDVAGAAPAVDGLSRVADHDDLGVFLLGEDDVLEDRVGVLGFVQQQEAGLEDGLGQGPHLEVVVVLEADRARRGVLQILPDFRGVRQEQVGEFGVGGLGFDAAQVQDMVVGDFGVGGLTVAGHGTQHRVGQGGGQQVAAPDTYGGVQAEVRSSLPARPAGAVKAIAVAAAEGSADQAAGRLTLDG